MIDFFKNGCYATAVPESNNKRDFSLIAIGIGLGFSIVAPILLFLWIGYWLDLTLGTGFLFSVVGAVIGICTATFIVVRKISALMREAEENAKKDITKE